MAHDTLCATSILGTKVGDLALDTVDTVDGINEKDQDEDEGNLDNRNPPVSVGSGCDDSVGLTTTGTNLHAILELCYHRAV